MPHGISSDVRFGSTFLDVKYEKHAVNGEVLSDKQDAELYLKRPSDGRVVAYSEKVASIYQIISELNIEFQTATGYKHPTEAESLFVISRFKTNPLTVNNTRDINILKENLQFVNSAVPGECFKFSISPKTNAFFLKPYLRHVDRNLVGYLTGLFTAYEENHKLGDAPDEFSEWMIKSPLYGQDSYASFKQLNNWKISNAIVYYQCAVTGYDNDDKLKTTTTSSQHCIRLNEQSYVSLPPGFDTGFKTITSITVRITHMTFPKLQYAYEIAGLNTRPDKLKGFNEDDGMMVVRDTAAYYFVTNIGDRVPETEKTSTFFCADWNFLHEAMNKASSNQAGGVYAKSEHPETGTWIADSMWVEEVRRVKSGNKTEQLNSENTFEELQKYIYVDNEIETEFTIDSSNPDGIYILRL